MLLICNQNWNTAQKYWIDKFCVVVHSYCLASTLFWPPWQRNGRNSSLMSCVNWFVYYFPIDTTIKYPKLTVIRLHKFIICYSCRCQKFKIGHTELKSRCHQVCVPSEGSNGDSSPLLLQLLRATWMPWPLHPSSYLQLSPSNSKPSASLL